MENHGSLAPSFCAFEKEKNTLYERKGKCLCMLWRTGGAVCFSGKAERFGIFDALEQQVLERKNRKIVTICC